MNWIRKYKNWKILNEAGSRPPGRTRRSQPEMNTWQEDWAASRSPKTSPKRLGELYDTHSDDLNFLDNLAIHPNTPPRILKLLSTKTVHHGELVAKNKNAPADVLDSLLGSANEGTIANVAKNPNATVEILEKIYSRPGSWKYHIWLASNIKCPTSILSKISRVWRNNHDPDGTMLALLQNSNTSTEDLERLESEAGDWETNYEFQDALSNNQNASIDQLRRLSKSPDPYVRGGVANNPNAPIESIAGLLTDSDYWVKLNARANLDKIKKERPELRDKIERLENISELGIRGDEESPDLSELDI